MKDPRFGGPNSRSGYMWPLRYGSGALCVMICLLPCRFLSIMRAEAWGRDCHDHVRPARIRGRQESHKHYDQQVSLTFPSACFQRPCRTVRPDSATYAHRAAVTLLEQTYVRCHWECYWSQEPTSLFFAFRPTILALVPPLKACVATNGSLRQV